GSRRSRDPTCGDRVPPAWRRGCPHARKRRRSPRARAPGRATGRRFPSLPRSGPAGGPAPTGSDLSAPLLDTCPCGRRQSNTFLLGELALRAIAPEAAPAQLTQPVGASTVISDYAFLNWGARATDQGVLPS